MDDKNLIRMVEQIADFYTPYTEAEAVEGIAAHLRKFWDPRMRDRITALARDPAIELRPVIAAAIDRLSTLS
jgi:formate dehydrogenase subunit delta